MESMSNGRHLGFENFEKLTPDSAFSLKVTRDYKFRENWLIINGFGFIWTPCPMAAILDLRILKN